MPRRKDPEKGKLSKIINELTDIQTAREKAWRERNKRDELPKQLVESREMTERCTKYVKISNGKVYPREIPETLYNFGDTYDAVVEQSSEIVKLMDSDKSQSESEETNSEDSNAKITVADSFGNMNDSTPDKNQDITFAVGSSSSTQDLDQDVLAVAGPSCSTGVIDQDNLAIAGPSCSKVNNSFFPVSEKCSSHSIIHSIVAGVSCSSFSEFPHLLKTYKSISAWYDERDKLPININGKNGTKIIDLSSSYLDDSSIDDYAGELENLNDNVLPSGKKKSRIDETASNIISDESDYSPDDDSESTDEDSPRYACKLFKSRRKNVLKTGYKTIRNEIGQTIQPHPIRHDNTQAFPGNICGFEKEKPMFDSEDRAIIHLENACDFQRFVVLDFPNMKSDEEDDLENDEAFKNWSAQLDEKCDKALKEKSLEKSRLQNAGNVDRNAAIPSTSKCNPELTRSDKKINDDEEENTSSLEKEIESCYSFLWDIVKEQYNKSKKLLETVPSAANQSTSNEELIKSTTPENIEPYEPSSGKQMQGPSDDKRMSAKSSTQSLSSINLKLQSGKKSIKSSPEISLSTNQLKLQLINDSLKSSVDSSSNSNLNIQSVEKSVESSANQLKLQLTNETDKSSVKSSISTTDEKLKSPKKSISTKVVISSVQKRHKSPRKIASVAARLKLKMLTKRVGLKSNKLTYPAKPKQQIKGKVPESSQESISSVVEQKHESKCTKLPVLSGKKQKSQSHVPKKSLSSEVEENLQYSKKSGSKSENVKNSFCKKQRQFIITKKQSQSPTQFVSPAIKGELIISNDEQSKNVRQNRCKPINDSTSSVKSKVLEAEEEQKSSTSCQSKPVKKKVSNPDREDPSGSFIDSNLRSKKNKKE